MTVSVFYPDADPETTSVDGDVGREVVSEDFATIRAGAGTLARPSEAYPFAGGIYANLILDRYEAIYRYIMLFDTAALPDADVISGATISLKADGGTGTGLGDMALDVVGSTPSTNTNIVTGDYAQLGTTVLGTVNVSALGGSYVAITLLASGISAINQSGVSKFGTRLGPDRSGSAPTWVSGQSTYASISSADVSGTTSDPKLTVTHAAASTFTPRAIVIS